MRRSTIVRIALGVGLSSFLLPGSVAPCYGDTIVAFASIFSLQAGAGTTLATQDHLFAAQQFDLILVVADGQIGFRLFILLIDLVDFQLLFFDAGNELCVVKLNDQILFLGE